MCSPWMRYRSVTPSELEFIGNEDLTVHPLSRFILIVYGYSSKFPVAIPENLMMLIAHENARGYKSLKTTGIDSGSWSKVNNNSAALSNSIFVLYDTMNVG